MPPPLNQLPWNVAKDQFGPQGADFIAVMGALMVRAAKDQIRPYLADPKAVPGTLPLSAKDQSRPPAYSDSAARPCNWSFTNSTCGGSTCESASRTASASLLASLAESGQQTPIVVVIAKDTTSATW
jgi:hypothetical protein